MDLFALTGGFFAALSLLGLLWRILRLIHKKFDELEAILPMLRDMAHEFGPNTGNSLRDRVNSIEHAQDMQSQVLAQHGRDLDRAIGSVNNLHTRLDGMVDEVIRRLDRRNNGPIA